MELAGQFLVAMPGMSDPRFARSVIFLCAYSDDGAMGLVINRRAKDITLADVFERMSLPAPDLPAGYSWRLCAECDAGCSGGYRDGHGP